MSGTLTREHLEKAVERIRELKAAAIKAANDNDQFIIMNRDRFFHERYQGDFKGIDIWEDGNKFVVNNIHLYPSELCRWDDCYLIDKPKTRLAVSTLDVGWQLRYGVENSDGGTNG